MGGKKPGATLESVLDKIFREPNESIRYPILAEYLRAIPERDLGKAFDICVRLEGAQVPDKIAAFLLQIWGERDPVGGWEKTKKLFRVVGIGDDWLLYYSCRRISGTRTL